MSRWEKFQASSLRTKVLAPMLAGWIANLLFASFGLYLLLKVRY